MMGFTESFNISVSAAIILYTLRERLEHLDLPWQLSDQEKDRLRYFWTRNSVKNAGLIERAFKKRKAK
jgi:tRNA (guanosine-2'-O-)-methyltransferase